MCVVAAAIGLSSRILIKRAVGEIVSESEGSKVHLKFGPISALVKWLSMGRGKSGLRLDGNNLEHHSIAENPT